MFGIESLFYFYGVGAVGNCRGVDGSCASAHRTEQDVYKRQLYTATAEATEASIYDALFEATTMTGRNGATVYALPVPAVLEMLRATHASP